MALTLHILDDPNSFLQVLNTATSSQDEITIDTATMNIVLGAAHDAQTQGNESIRMLVTSSGCKLAGAASVDTYMLDITELPQESSLSLPPILLAIGSPTLETYFLATPVPLPNSAGKSTSYLNNVISAVVKITFGAYISKVYSAFGPQVLVSSFLEAWRTANEKVECQLQICQGASLATRLAWLSKERCAELYGGQTVAPPSDITATSSIGLGGSLHRTHAAYTVLDISSLAGLVGSKAGLQFVEKQSIPPSDSTVQSVTVQLVQCILAFWARQSDESTRTAENMIQKAKKQQGRLWICLASQESIQQHEGDEPTVMGYLYVGRETPNTISIRNVYTKDEHRGRGVAAALVKAACKWHLLGAREQWSSDLSTVAGGLGREANTEKAKAVVTLFVEPENTAALKTYLKVGFVVDEVPWERRGFEGIRMGNF